MIVKDAVPQVSVVIPCRNEGMNIIRVLHDLSEQDWQGSFEVIVADGESDDDTWVLLEQFRDHQSYPFEFVLAQNPGRLTPHGLNVAVKLARAPMIIRIDGHSRLREDYIRKIVLGLSEPDADVVGPQIQYVPAKETTVAKAIAAILNSKLGNGGTASRNKLSVRRKVEHTVMSCFHKRVWEAIGGYDEKLHSNEDFDFDYRARKHGFEVYSLPEPFYYPLSQGTMKGLCKQRWRYGFWKAQVLKKYPKSLKLRQLIPMISLPVLIGSLFFPMVFVTFSLLYFLAVLMNMRGTLIENKNAVYQYVLQVMILFIIQFVWSAGLWYGWFANRKSS
jgi:glycosyltransferase involved in cell wall biosynthesis